jgi:DNA helicase MCM8
MSVNSIRGSKPSTSNSNEDEEGGTSPFSVHEREAIKNIAGRKNSFKLLVDSLCPDIFGHEIIKAGLLLALFRGRENPTARSNPHVLIVGDPGLGKSQMLSSVAAVAPRSVFVGANTSTAAGLTATLHQEGGPGEYALEAGALVLADQGCCCIDEFDKLGEHRVLLDVMEQQVVNVAKAGVVCSLPARTSILAAANPIGGHYNHDKTISQNIKMNEALLSRFDLIFVLLDKPDQEIDRYLSERILSKISSSTTTKTKAKAFSNAKSLVSQISDTNESSHSSAFLRSLLKKDSSHGGGQRNNHLISQQQLRKYISYAQRFVSPRLSKEASQALKEFYLDCRQNSPSDSLPITTRQLESAIRLSEARAKAELRAIVTKEDAEDVIAIM